MAGEDNPNFEDFSSAYDDVQAARKALAAFGTARLADPLSIELIVAQKAFVEAATRYRAIVDALINPKI